MDNFLFIGKILKAVGLKGFIHINFVNQDKDCLIDEPYLFIKENNGYNQREIEGLRVDKPYIIKLSGIDDRTEAEKYLGKEIYLEADELEDDDGEVYLEDLIGAKVFSEGVERGVLASVNNYGASDIMEITLPDGKSVLMPYIVEIVQEIDIKEKIIFIKNIDDYI